MYRKILILNALILCLFVGCSNNESYKIKKDTVDVYSVKINKDKYLKDVIGLSENTSDEFKDTLEGEILGTAEFLGYSFNDVNITMLDEERTTMKLTDYLSNGNPTFIARISAYCSHCDDLQLKNIYDRIVDTDYNLLIWVQTTGVDDHIEYIEDKGIDASKYGATITFTDDLYELNELGYPNTLFLNYNNELSVLFKNLQPGPNETEFILSLLTSENY